MKGFVSKALSLALLISVVPSFAMEERIVDAADKMEQATSATTSAKSGLIVGATNYAFPSIWEKVKAMGSYVAETRAAQYFTGGQATAHVKKAAPYAIGAAALFAAYKLYAYMTTKPATKAEDKPAAQQATVTSEVVGNLDSRIEVVAKGAKAPAVQEPKTQAQPVKVATPEYDATMALLDRITADIKAGTKNLSAKYGKELEKHALLTSVGYDSVRKGVTMRPSAEEVSWKLYSETMKSWTSYCVFMQETLLMADGKFTGKNLILPGSGAEMPNDARALNRVKTCKAHLQAFVAHKTNGARVEARAQVKAASTARTEQGKLEVQSNWRKAYNFVANRYTAGLALAAGLGYAGYKYGVPFYNKVK